MLCGRTHCSAAEPSRASAHAATEWRVKFGSGGAPKDDAMLSVHVAPTDREVLEQAAAVRGLSTASFPASLVHVITSERLLRPLWTTAVIELPSRGERDYLAQFGVTASTSPARASSASAAIWRAWVPLPPPGGSRPAQAEQVLVAIGQHPRRTPRPLA